jgi:hypothetical protein
MRFVLVNGRTPIRATLCLQCCEKIEGGYLRDTATRLPYCDYACYAHHESRSAATRGIGFVWRAGRNEGFF